MLKAIQLEAYGRVQGVGFRWMTKMVADQLNIKGTVENRADGSVKIIAVGLPEPLATFMGLVKASPSPSGKVTNLITTELENVPQCHKFNVIG